MPHFTYWRLPQVMQSTGRGRSATYADIQAGTFPPPIKWGRRTSIWPSNEVQAVMQARLAGRTEDEVRTIVAELVKARKSEVAAA